MKHLIIPASWKSAAAMRKTIENKEKEKWNVVALGDIAGSNVLIFANDGNSYEHEIIQIFWSLKGKVSDIIAEKQIEGWKVATLGACLGSSLLIIKRIIEDKSESSSETLS